MLDAGLLQAPQPVLDRLLAETPISAEAHVRYLAGAGLSPDPILRDAEALRDLVDCQQTRHGSARRAGPFVT